MNKAGSTTVLEHIEPECCTLAPLRQIDLCQRADGMFAAADTIDRCEFGHDSAKRELLGIEKYDRMSLLDFARHDRKC
jgi:hypothetical protein